MIVKHQSDYVARRRGKYPPVGDQLDMLFKGYKQLIESGAQLPPAHLEWVEVITSVKTNFPKPTDGTGS